MTLSAGELWVMDRTGEIRDEHPQVDAADAEERAELESRRGRCPYRQPEPGPPLETIDEWLWRI